MKRLIEFLGGPAGWSQHARLLTLSTPAGPDVLIAESARIDEALGPVAGHAGFRIELSALATDAALDLSALLGQPARLELQTSQSRSALRPFHGHLTEASRLGANGGFARYRLLIEPWLSFLGHNQDSYLFQDKTVIEIIDEVLDAWKAQGRLAPAWRWAVDPAAYPRRGMTVQYRESDLAFIKRLLVEEGLFCWFEHQGGDGEPFGAHTLVLADHNGAFREGSQGRIRFTQAGATLREDSIERWSGLRQLGSTASHAGSWDYRTLSTRPQAAPSRIDNGAAPPAASWHDPGLYAWPDSPDGRRRLDARRQAEDARLKQFLAEGTVRSAAPGTTFHLADHPEHAWGDSEGRRFLITAVTHRARNNLAEQLPGALAALGPPDADSAAPFAKITEFYRNRFHAQRAAIPWRAPALDAAGRPLHPRPPAPGLLSAVVVGAGQPTHTDRELRVRVQFAWQRGSHSASRQAHPAGTDNAPASDALGVWLRVATPAAGANWGGQLTPRPGQEVLVAFLHGNIDRPVIIGALYNGQGTPDAPGNRIGAGSMQASPAAPAFFHGEAPAHAHRASLSGFKTQQLATTRDGRGGHNQLVFDDTPGEARLELSTTQHRSRLQLGHLKQHDDNARLADRGHGAELATLAAAALRAGKGLLLSADACCGGTGAHLDSRAAITHTETAEALSRSLAEAAAHQGAAFRHDPPSDQLPASAALRHAAEVLRATAELALAVPARPPGDGRIQATEGGTGRVPAWSAARLQYSAPAGLAQLTPGGLFLVAGRHLALATGRHTQLIAQGHHSLAASTGVLLFSAGQTPPQDKKKDRPAPEPGIHLHAASGQVSVESQSGQTRAAADRKVTLASTAAGLHASAQRHLLATAQGAYLKIDGGNIQLHAPGKVEFKGSQKNL